MHDGSSTEGNYRSYNLTVVELISDLMQEETTENRLSYFVNAMPVKHKKHFYITINLPEDEVSFVT